MAAKKNDKAKVSDADADEPKSAESSGAAGVEPFVALPNVYRADMGEALPPQKPAGVE